MCLTNHTLQNIPLVSCCLHLWSCLVFFCKYLYILSLFIAPFIKKKNITYVIKRCKSKMKMQSYFWEKFITKSHVTFCHYSLFCTKSVGCAQTITHEKEKNNNKKTWLCHWSCLDHVLSIKTFTEKKLLCLRLFEYLGLTINGALHSHNTCFPRNLGQRAFA